MTFAEQFNKEVESTEAFDNGDGGATILIDFKDGSFATVSGDHAAYDWDYDANGRPQAHE